MNSTIIEPKGLENINDTDVSTDNTPINVLSDVDNDQFFINKNWDIDDRPE